MKSLVLRVLCFWMSMCIFCSCNTKQSTMNELRDLANDLQENSQNYTGTEWEEAIIKYCELEELLAENTYTDEELKEIGRMKARCISVFVRAYVVGLKGYIHNVKKQLEGAMEEFNGQSSEWEDLLNEFRE